MHLAEVLADRFKFVIQLLENRGRQRTQNPQLIPQLLRALAKRVQILRVRFLDRGLQRFAAALVGALHVFPQSLAGEFV